MNNIILYNNIHDNKLKTYNYDIQNGGLRNKKKPTKKTPGKKDSSKKRAKSGKQKGKPKALTSADNTFPESGDLKVLVPENYNYGKCGEDRGFCNGTRYCNKSGECGPKNTHNETSPKSKYRLCVENTDKDCVRKALCTADKNNDIKCRVIFAQ